MKIKRHNASIPGATRSHRIGAAIILIALAGFGFFAVHSILSQEAAVLAQRTQSLQDRGRLVQQLFTDEEKELNSLLLHLRSDLRSDGHWARETEAQSARESTPGASANASDSVDREESAQDEPGDGGLAKEVAVRLGTDALGSRWRKVRADLKRGLMNRADLLSLEMVVADQAGLTAIRVARTAQGIEEEFEDPRAAKGVAKAIWYAEEIRRAVAASGRKLTRGTLTPTGRGESERMVVRVAIGLHDPSELVQGVLVATVDFAKIVDTALDSAGSDIQSRIVNLEGQTLNSVPASDPTRDAERDAALAARLIALDQNEPAFIADDLLIHGFGLAHEDGSASEAVLVLETALPPNGLLARASSPWGIGLIAACLIAALSILGLLRWARRRDADPQSMKDVQSALPREKEEATEPAEQNAPEADEAQTAANSVFESSEPFLARERIVLRDWLGDVRGCLERDAAIRGLSFNLQCERSLPRFIVQDPGWLGGLLVAMGQEALDATSEERVLVRVQEDAHEVLRFEVDAGAVDLSPVSGMIAVANKLGGRFETQPAGGLAFLVPLAPS